MKGKTNRQDRFSTPPAGSDKVKAPKGESMEEMAKRLGFSYTKKG